MGLIRVSEDAEARIKELSTQSGRTITSVVDTLVASNDVAARLDKMGEYLESQFNALRSLIEDTTVDRIATPTRRTSSIQRWDWEEVKNLYFDLPESSPAWYPKVYDMWGQSSAMDMFNFVSDGETLYSEFEGVKTPLVHLTPEVLSILGGSDVAQS